MNQFRIFKQVPRILFGKESIKRIAELLPKKNHSDEFYLYIIDDFFKGTGLNDELKIQSEDLLEWFPSTMKEPSTAQIDELVSKVKNIKHGTLPISIIGIGGGSTMDVAKAISVMLKNHGSASEYQGWDLVKSPGIHKVGIPTISGSGSEASRTAVLMGPDKKFGINSDYSMFDAILLDSNFIKTVPKDKKFYSGMDCFIHCVESLQGTMINELSRGNALIALNLCKKSFLEEGSSDELMAASYFGGVSIVNSEVGICHALSYGLSIELGFRHGLANCVAFNVLDEYYGDYVNMFREMMKRNGIELQKNVCSSLSSEQIDRMVLMTLRMDRPLTNALGSNWRDLLNEDKIRSLYLSM